jgi:RimJ/RimL family protein N-acetyltransferase
MEVQQGGAPAPAAELEVSLREFTLSDADAEAFMSWASDPRVVRFQRRDAYEHVDQARRYIADHVLPHPWYRAICAGAGAPLPVVGSISVKPGPAEDGRLFRASVGYRVAYAHWGRGVATRAVRAAAEAVFAAWPWLLRLEAVADVENPASQRVLEKAGFVREGVLRKYILLKGRPRDMVMFSIVVDTDTDTDRRRQQNKPGGP